MQPGRTGHITADDLVSEQGSGVNSADEIESMVICLMVLSRWLPHMLTVAAVEHSHYFSKEEKEREKNNSPLCLYFFYLSVNPWVNW